MNRLQRYLFRNLAIATFYAAIGLTLTIWLTQSLRLVQIVVEAGAPLRMFIWLLLLTVPTFLGLILPIAMMGALLFTYNRMTMDSEMVVMRAAGVGPMGLGKPAFAMAGLVALIVMAFNTYLAPAAHQSLVALEYSVRSEYGHLVIREGVFTEIGPGLSIYVRKRDSDGNLYGILVHDARDKSRPQTTLGERAVVQLAPEGSFIVVHNGHKQDLDRATGQASDLFFDRYTIDLVVSGGQTLARRPDTRERSTAELLDPPPEIRADERAMRQFMSELNSRLASPLYPLALAMVALAFLLTGDFNRRGQTVRIALATGGAVAVEGGMLGLTGLSTNTIAAVPLLYLMPLAVIAICLAVLVRRLGPVGVHGGRAKRLPLLG